MTADSLGPENTTTEAPAFRNTSVSVPTVSNDAACSEHFTTATRNPSAVNRGTTADNNRVFPESEKPYTPTTASSPIPPRNPTTDFNPFHEPKPK